MIIDTERLKQAISAHEENRGINWETCSLSILNSSEKRVIDRLALVEQIEELLNNESGNVLSEYNQLAKLPD